ncbi:antitoxin VbhA family protein [Acidithiobacillus ferriphilus]|uniref:antitoxin VbhA family protein n=1 Tax=Acidithiobacillus ferriphilus TaxID=1689834 RepID=UPI002DBE051B|nr:antitoxin VbhA family protein [Acidithiobacillus ferriphilus]MEB8534724.1 antitoxin VbhA family protein [Acidithiobacillus ferriphilus]
MSDQRQYIVKEALANQRLEGLEVSKEAQDAAQLWATGKITVDEVIRIIKEKHVRRPG